MIKASYVSCTTIGGSVMVDRCRGTLRCYVHWKGRLAVWGMVACPAAAGFPDAAHN